MTQYDLCVIGAGSGGVRAARMVANLGASVAVVEQDRFGGTCVNVGCVPKKYYVIASGFGQQFQLSKDYGWDTPQPAFSFKKLKQAKDKEISRLNGIYESLLDTAGVTSYRGHARLTGHGTVAIGDTQIQADKILIATGTRPFMPTNLANNDFAMVSDDIFDLEQLPTSLAVYGGGYIAIEFACIFAALGVETHLIYRGNQLLKQFDQETVGHAQESFRNTGLNIHLNTTIETMKGTTGDIQLQLNNQGQQSTRQVGSILMATGRVANTDDLGLDTAGVERNKQGFIPVGNDYQSSIPGIYALGDVSGGIQLTPMATAEAMDFTRQHFAPDAPHQLPKYVATVTFSQPNIATVGLGEEQARKQFNNVQVYKSHFTPLQFALGAADNKPRSFMKILVDGDTDTVIGMHMVGDGSGEVIQGFATAMEAGISKQQLDQTLGIHPTTAEEFVSMYQAADD